MADIFTKNDAISLLRGKFILFMGDSNTRALYNDVIYLLQHNDITPTIVFKAHTRSVNSPLKLDKIVKYEPVDNATRNILEIREYCNGYNTRVRFCFITKIDGRQMNEQLNEIEQKNVPTPDIVVLNSCLWDLMRWGPKKENDYKESCVRTFSRLRTLLDEKALIIWTTTLPLASQVRGGVMINQHNFIGKYLRYIIMEANTYMSQLCALYGFDLLDFHYHMRFQLSRRCSDGTHWERHAVRQLTCILLTHIALSNDVRLPNRVFSRYLKNAIDDAFSDKPDNLSADGIGINVIRFVENQLTDERDDDPCKRKKKKAKRKNNVNPAKKGGALLKTPLINRFDLSSEASDSSAVSNFVSPSKPVNFRASTSSHPYKTIHSKNPNTRQSCKKRSISMDSRNVPSVSSHRNYDTNRFTYDSKPSYYNSSAVVNISSAQNVASVINQRCRSLNRGNRSRASTSQTRHNSLDRSRLGSSSHDRYWQETNENIGVPSLANSGFQDNFLLTPYWRDENKFVSNFHGYSGTAQQPVIIDNNLVHNNVYGGPLYTNF